MTEEEALNRLTHFLKNKGNSGPVFRYRHLQQIICEYPHLASKAFVLFNMALHSNKNDYISLRIAYSSLSRIIEKQPDLADEAFDLFKIALQSNKNNYSSIGFAYSSLAKITQKHPAFTQKSLVLLKTAFRSDKNEYSSVGWGYQALAGIIKKRPEIAEKCFDLFKTGFMSRKNDYDSMSTAYKVLAEIIQERPEFSERSFDLFKEALSSAQNNYASIVVVYQTLATMLKKHPEFSDKCLDLFKTALSSDKHDSYASEVAYESLGVIAVNRPELTDRCLELFKKVLLSEKNDYRSMNLSYKILLRIFKRQPESADKLFALFKTALQSDKNKSVSLKTAYETLGEIILSKSKYAPKGLELFQTALKSDQNKNFSLTAAAESLIEVLDITGNRPKLTEEVLHILEVCKDIRNHTLDDTDENEFLYHNDHYHRETYQSGFLYSLNRLLLVITNARPDLAGRTLAIASEYSPSDIFLPTFKSCMRRLPLEETLAKYPNIAQNLRVAHNGRFATDEEFHYALQNFNKPTLANSNIFRMQQRVMNILFSLSAQEAGISKEDALTFRKPDAPEDVKEHLLHCHWWATTASFNGAVLFREYFPSYIKTIQNHNRKNPEDAISVHDAVYWLPSPMDADSAKKLAKFIQRHLIYQNAEHKNVHRPLHELQIIALNWKTIEKRLQDQNKDISRLKYADVLATCKTVQYENQRHEGFAAEAAKHAVPKSAYHDYEDIYLAGLKVPEPFNSTKEFKIGKYKGRFLPRSDVRIGFFGNYTNCCQHFDGIGHSCAVSTVKDPFSQLFVVEDDKGKIIAGSWAWENTEGKYREVCFDNIESLGELKQRPEINQIYEEVGKYLAQKQNCRRVTIGTGCQDADVSGYKPTKAISLPRLYGQDTKNTYSDANKQVLLAQNINAVPLDKTLESPRYIRSVCSSDIKAMSRISKLVFPDGDQTLQVPKNMSGFVIEDYNQGVVGYVLYNKEEKEIYDMAVLPKYRTDKNASSGKLLLEMLKEVKKEGGTWHAELRDKTTLRYMEIMQARGLVKLQKNGIDHEMSDGSKVVSVSFEPVTDKRPNTLNTNRLNKHGNTGR